MHVMYYKQEDYIRLEKGYLNIYIQNILRLRDNHLNLPEFICKVQKRSFVFHQ